jgi:ferredoxin
MRLACQSYTRGDIEIEIINSPAPRLKQYGPG